MPTTYTGNETNVTADRADVTGVLPVDGEPRNASSVNTPLQRLYDYAQRARKKAGFLDLASTWTALQTFSAGIATTLANFSGNVTVGGSLGVTGPTTLAALTANAVTAPYPSSFTTPAQVYFLASAASGYTTGTGPQMENYSANFQSTTAGTTSVGFEIKVPGGATITTLEFSFGNVDGTPRGVSTVYASIRPADMGLGGNQVLVSNGTVRAPPTGNTSTPQWIGATLASTALIVPAGGHVYVRCTLDNTTTNGALLFYGVRLLATVPTARFTS